MQLFLHYYFWVNPLLVKLKILYIQHTWILIMEKEKSNQKSEGWKDGRICQNFWLVPLQV